MNPNEPITILPEERYRASRAEVAAAMATIAAARRALAAGGPADAGIFARVETTLDAVARWRRPEDDLLFALAAELELLRDLLQAGLAQARQSLAEHRSHGAAARAYGQALAQR